MPTPGPLELVIILVIALLVLGPGKLPDVGSALGKSLREFRKAAGDIQEATKIDMSPLGSAQPAAPATPATPAAPATPAPAAPAAAVAPAAAPVDSVPAAPVATPATSAPDVPGGAGLSAPPQPSPSDQPRPESLS